MKSCTTCSTQVSDSSKTGRCFSCRKKETMRRYIDTHKEGFLSYQKEYRGKNRSWINEKAREKNKVAPPEYSSGKAHYRKSRGIPLDAPPRKKKNGEGNIDAQGYKTITVKGHPNQMDERGRIREHVYIMAQSLGRPLRKNESVHHKNGIRDDNRIENLELWGRGQPPGQRIEDKKKWAIEFLESYGYKVQEVS